MSASTKAFPNKALYRVAVLLALLVSMTACAFAYQKEGSGLNGMAISPLMFRKTVSAGLPVSLPIKINNLEGSRLNATISIKPVIYADGTYAADVTSGKKTRFDCSGWFAESTTKMVVGARSEKEVSLKLTVPRETPPGVYYCLGLIDPTVEGSTDKILAEYELPIILFVGRQQKLDLTFGTPNLVANPKGDNFVDVPFTNPSEAFTVVGAMVTVRNLISNTLLGKPLIDTDRNMYPETSRTLRFSIGSHVPDGRYQVQVVFQAGTRAFRPISANFIVRDGVATPETAGSRISLPPFLVDPPREHLAMPAGARRTMVIKFTNTTDGDLTLALTAHKLMQSLNGALGAIDDGPSGAVTVSILPDTIVIGPKRTSAVRVDVALDASATGDTWFAISARSAKGDSLSEEVYCSITVPKTEQPKLQINAGAPDKLQGVPISVDYDVINVGNIALKPIVYATVLTSDLARVETCEVPVLGDGGIIPGATLHNRIMLPLTLQPGTYALQISYQYGEELYEKKLIPFTIPKKAAAPPKGKGGAQ